MKSIFLSLIIQSLIFTLSTAQKIDRAKGSITRIEIDYLFGNIVVKGTNNDHIEVELLKDNELPEKFLEHTKKKDYEYKKSNTKLDLYIEESGTILRIHPCSLKSQFSDYVIRIPNDFEVKIKNDLSFFGGTQYSGIGNIKLKHEIGIENILNNIEIETFYADINTKGISGPIVANSFHGNMTIAFDKLNQELPSSIKTFHGDIDVALPSDSNCDITINTFKGKFNSDFQFNDVDSDYRPFYRTTIIKDGIEIVNNSEKLNKGALKGKINRGGVELKLKTHTGNINLFNQ